jgi:hypothetical protein
MDKELASIIKDLGTLVFGAIGGAFVLWRWMIDQKWRRVQYAQQLIKEFTSKENTKRAFEFLDSHRQVDVLPGEYGGGKSKAYADEGMLIASLKTSKEITALNQLKTHEYGIRNSFDEFFTDLSSFQHHVETGLIKIEDIKPYLEYWIKSINGYGKIHGPALAKQINKFLKDYDYLPVIKLSKSMGYTPKDLMPQA